MTPTFAGLPIVAAPYVPPGKMLVLNYDGGMVLVRHLSEMTPTLAGTTWHVGPTRCPTWTDAAECRCMLGGDA